MIIICSNLMVCVFAGTDKEFTEEDAIELFRNVYAFDICRNHEDACTPEFYNKYLGGRYVTVEDEGSPYWHKMLGYHVGDKVYPIDTVENLTVMLEMYYTNAAAKRYKYFITEVCYGSVENKMVYSQRFSLPIKWIDDVIKCSNLKIEGNTAKANIITEWRYIGEDSKQESIFYSIPIQYERTDDGWRISYLDLFETRDGPIEAMDKYRIDSPDTGDNTVLIIAIAAISLVTPFVIKKRRV